MSKDLYTEFSCPDCGGLEDVQYSRKTNTFYCTDCEERYSVNKDISELVCAKCKEPLEISSTGNIIFEKVGDKLYHEGCCE